MTTPTHAQQLEEDKDTLRFILSGYPNGRYTLERRAITRALAALEAVGDAEILTIGYSSREDVMHRITDDWMLDFKDREASKGDPADGDYYLIPADAAGRLEMTALKAGKRGAK